MPFMLMDSKDQAYIYTCRIQSVNYNEQVLNTFLLVWLPGRLISGWNQTFHTFWITTK